MRISILLLFIGSFTMIISCKKGKADFVLKGLITDTTFGGGLDGSTIKLYETEGGGTKTNLLGTVQSSDGNYSFTFPRNAVEYYTIVVQKENYFEINEQIGFSSLSVSEDNTRNFSTTAKAWVNLRFVNQLPASSTDELKFTKQAGKSGCDECCETTQQILTGIVDTSIICINDGNETYSYLYFDSQTSTSSINSVVTTAFDTTELLLTY